MLLKKLILCCALICLSSLVYAADNESEQLLSTLDQPSQPQSPPVQEELPDRSDVQQPEAPHTASFFSAFGTVSCKVFSATLLLSNTFGRLALAGCLGYKAYESATKAMQNDVKRNKYILKAVCCFGAACMLLQDGYQWVLRQGAGA